VPTTLIIGPANAAKAGAALGSYALAARRDALLVLPTSADVAHYERELASPGVTLGRVLTFPGLIDEIAARAAYRRGRLAATTRELVLRRVIAAARLEALEGPAGAPGFVRAAGRMIASLQLARVDPQRFSQAMRSWSLQAHGAGALASDLAAIYRRYRRELDASDLVDAELYAWEALDALRARPQNWGATPLYLYGFDDLTAIELDAVQTLSERVGVAVTVALTYEPGRPALAARASVVEELRAHAHTVTELEARDDYYAPAARGALHHLERHLFEAEASAVDPGPAAVLMEAGSEWSEAELVAAEVLQTLRAGVAPSDIVVVCRNLERSGARLERALERVGVQVTSARRVPLAHTALGRALLGLVRYALAPVAGRDVSDLIAYLRRPGVVASTDALDAFEQQVRLAGGDAGQAMRAGGAQLHAALAMVERLRRERDRLVAVGELTRWLLAAPGRERAPLFQAAERVDAHAATVVSDALTELADLRGRPVTGTELILALESLQVPVHAAAGRDTVLVSDPLAIRARRFRHVFLTGLCDGEFPSLEARGADPLLSDERRREVALASGLVLPSAPDPLERERYLLYACLSRATDRICVSYRSSDADGNLVVASSFLDELVAVFGEPWLEARRRRPLADVAWEPDIAPTRRDWLLARELVAARQPAGLAPGGLAPGGLAPAVATKQLSARVMPHVRHRRVISAGALEAYAACPVRWLVERQLKPQQLDPEPDALARGSYMHRVLERVFRQLADGLTPATLPRAEGLLVEAMGGHDSAAERAKLAVDQPAEVRAAILRGIEAELLRYLRAEAGDGRSSRPVAVELRFGLGQDGDGAPGPVELRDGEDAVLLGGIIDRVDADPTLPRTLVVRDYKSGAKNASWPAARWRSDNQFQVGLYMIAAGRLLGARAVAGFYQPLSGEDLRPRGVYEAGFDPGPRVVSRDELAPEELDLLLAGLERDAVALAGQLARGELTPCPERCSPEGLCRHPGICWARS
jgi:ATP-dependent helicase/DNAse subunit B